MPVARSISVLIVDDQESMRGIVRAHLKGLGFERFTEAGSVAEALDKLKMGPVGLIMSDFNMNGATGLDLLKAVRAHPVLKKTPFIMVTGNADRETVTTVMQAGVNNYVVKPVSAINLRARIEQVLGKLT